MIMSVGNLIVPARDKSSLGNSILMSVGQSGGGGRLHAYMHGNRSGNHGVPTKSISLRNGTGSAISNLRSIKSSNLKF